MNPELRNCPFCGSTAKLVLAEYTMRYVAMCEGCEARMCTGNREDAIKAWNRRLG